MHFGSCYQAKGLKVTCILCYCSEGDNIPDSFQLAEASCKLLGLSVKSFHGEFVGVFKLLSTSSNTTAVYLIFF